MQELILNNKLMSHPVIAALMDAATKRGGLHFARVMIFLEMLANSANGFFFASYEHLGIRRSYPLSQCEVVWNTCISLSVLRKTEYGYSANEWLSECGFITVEQESAFKATNEAKKTYQTRIPVRPNVFITQEQMNELSRMYSQEQISRILDSYSDWKVQKKATSCDDWKQIMAWGGEAFKDEKKQGSAKPAPKTTAEEMDFIRRVSNG